MQHAELDHKELVEGQAPPRPLQGFFTVREVDLAEGHGQIQQVGPLAQHSRQVIHHFRRPTIHRAFDQAAHPARPYPLGERVDGHQTPGVDEVFRFQELVLRRLEDGLPQELIRAAADDHLRPARQALGQVRLVEPNRLHSSRLVHDGGLGAHDAPAGGEVRHLLDRAHDGLDCADTHLGDLLHLAVIVVAMREDVQEIANRAHAQAIQAARVDAAHPRQDVDRRIEAQHGGPEGSGPVAAGWRR